MNLRDCEQYPPVVVVLVQSNWRADSRILVMTAGGPAGTSPQTWPPQSCLLNPDCLKLVDGVPGGAGGKPWLWFGSDGQSRAFNQRNWPSVEQEVFVQRSPAWLRVMSKWWCWKIPLQVFVYVLLRTLKSSGPVAMFQWGPEQRQDSVTESEHFWAPSCVCVSSRFLQEMWESEICSCCNINRFTRYRDDGEWESMVFAFIHT